MGTWLGSWMSQRRTRRRSQSTCPRTHFAATIACADQSCFCLVPLIQLLGATLCFVLLCVSCYSVLRASLYTGYFALLCNPSYSILGAMHCTLGAALYALNKPLVPIPEIPNDSRHRVVLLVGIRHRQLFKILERPCGQWLHSGCTGMVW